VRSWGYELVGGCIAPGDIVVVNPAPAPKPVETNPFARD
jgi:hypothetical protein